LEAEAPGETEGAEVLGQEATAVLVGKVVLELFTLRAEDAEVGQEQGGMVIKLPHIQEHLRGYCSAAAARASHQMVVTVYTDTTRGAVAEEEGAL
jgi:hypothetical protein